MEGAATSPAVGTVLGTLEDGAVVTQGEEGRRIYTYADGRIVTQNAEGDTETDKRADGLLIENFPNGVLKQTQPDGTVIMVYSKTGVKVQIKGTVKITSMPGCLMQEDSATGYRAMRFPDGYELVEMDDGTSIDVAPSGETKVTKKDGTIIETFEDGSKRVTRPDGTQHTVPPPP